jgi:hypothetical protein
MNRKRLAGVALPQSWRLEERRVPESRLAPGKKAL